MKICDTGKPVKHHDVYPAKVTPPQVPIVASDPNDFYIYSNRLKKTVRIQWNPERDCGQIDGVTFTRQEIQSLIAITPSPTVLHSLFILKDVFDGVVGDGAAMLSTSHPCNYKGIPRTVSASVCTWHKEMNDEHCQGCKR